jgi:hypothetical protein
MAKKRKTQTSKPAKKTAAAIPPNVDLIEAIYDIIERAGPTVAAALLARSPNFVTGSPTFRALCAKHFASALLFWSHVTGEQVAAILKG